MGQPAEPARIGAQLHRVQERSGGIQERTGNARCLGVLACQNGSVDQQILRSLNAVGEIHLKIIPRGINIL